MSLLRFPRFSLNGVLNLPAGTPSLRDKLSLISLLS
jgi:hypothetical protein